MEMKEQARETFETVLKQKYVFRNLNSSVYLCMFNVYYEILILSSTKCELN